MQTPTFDTSGFDDRSLRQLILPSSTLLAEGQRRELNRYVKARIYGGMAMGALTLLFVFLWMMLVTAHAAVDVIPFQTVNPPAEMPDLAFEDKDGKPRQLSEFKGKFVVVNLWATWCGPCKEEKPLLEKLQKDFAEKGLEVVAISQDFAGMPRVLSFYEREGITALQPYVDVKNMAMRATKADGLPASYLIDRDGKLVAYFVGMVDWKNPAVRGYLERLLEKPAEAAETKNL